MYHGWADPGISAAGTVAYYEQMVEEGGGQKDADAFARLYMIPGMHHCSGGAGTSSFDMLPALGAVGGEGHRTRAACRPRASSMTRSCGHGRSVLTRPSRATRALAASMTLPALSLA